MLKVKCKRCSNWLYSPLLAELDKVECPDCGIVFVIEHLYVATGSFNIYRDSLIKNIHEYTHLLKESRIELNAYLKNSCAGSTNQESIKTLKAFISELEELLSGCRESVRTQVEKCVVKYSADTIPRKGTLINISTTGMCIKTRDKAETLDNGTFLILIIGDMICSRTIYLHGEVVWQNKKRHMGIRFVNKEPEVDDKIRHYIKNGVPKFSLQTCKE